MLLDNILFILLNVPDTGSTSDLLFKAIIGTIVGGTGIYKLFEYVVQKRQERKDKQYAAKIDQENKKIQQSHNLEMSMFEFDKEKYLADRSSNEQFQKEIINEIFAKFVDQTTWIQKIHDQSIESIKNDLSELNKTVKDIYVQNDVLSNRVRNIEDRVLKGNSIITTKIEAILLYFTNKKNDIKK